jgi:hypothetical protein
MASEARRQVGLLAALLVVLAGVLAWQFWPTAGTAGPATAAQRTPASRPGAATSGLAEVQPPEVRLSALEQAPPSPNAAARNPFRFRAAPAPDAQVGNGRRPPAGPVAPPPGESGPPPGPPPPPPIPYKFVGTLSSPSTKGRVAVLSDGKFVYYGREGDIIEGRYRLVKIGEESLQIEYADGRGRQTLRMSGS